jgi:transcriptional regulator with XRE-family HTH domain
MDRWAVVGGQTSSDRRVRDRQGHVVTIVRMDDARIGAACRAVRIRKRLTQADLARLASVRRVEISRLETGAISGMPLSTLRSVAGALGMWFDLTPRWRGVDLDRMLNGAHTTLQNEVLARFERLLGWVAVPEVSFSIFGERGAIDVLGWHAASRTLLIVEIKTFLVDPAELVRKMDQRTRLAPQIARERGWGPRTVARWVILTDTRTNRRHVAAHRAVLTPLAATDGHRMRAWLTCPDGSVSALSFWSSSGAVIARRVRTGRTRAGTRGAG